MLYASMPCDEYTEKLASKAPVPGGGGASALAGAIGTALGSMVGALTVGKKKYAGAEARMYELMRSGEQLRLELLALSDKDAQVFEPLAAAYRLPSGTEEEKQYKEGVMEKALAEACLVPLEIMEKCGKALELLEEYAAFGSALAVSDAGVGAALCRGALQGAALNVMINIRSMKEETLRGQYRMKMNELLEAYVPLADRIYAAVSDRLA